MSEGEARKSIPVYLREGAYDDAIYLVLDRDDLPEAITFPPTSLVTSIKYKRTSLVIRLARFPGEDIVIYHYAGIVPEEEAQHEQH